MKTQTTNKKTEPLKIEQQINPQECRRFQLHEQAFKCFEADDQLGFYKSILELRRGNPNEPWMDHIEGFLHSANDDQATAIPFLRRAVKGLPDSIVPKITLGIALLKNKECDEAEAVLEEALAIEPDSFLALTNLACVLLTRDKNACLERAEEVLRRAEKLMPDDAAVVANLGLVLAKQGKKTEAHSTLLRAIGLDQCGVTCRPLAMIYPELKDAVNRRLAELELCTTQDGLKANNERVKTTSRF